MLQSKLIIKKNILSFNSNFDIKCNVIGKIEKLSIALRKKLVR